MDLHLYDSARGQVVPVEFREPGKFSIYVCGPTVYDYPHIGHGRAVLTYDVLRRYLESRGIEVHHVSNITDVDDKIIKRAAEEGTTTADVTGRYEKEWYAATDALGVARPHGDPHATAYIEQMVELIGRLMDAGAAYETSDSVYLSSETVPGYGLLARQSMDSLRAGARVEGSDEKRSPVDFALWKKSDTEPSWPSPWGAGRPGWHTECVVMSLDLLGDGFDLHAGGQDLMFPHHENERAQAVVLGNVFARHWMHHGFVEVAGEKMSKSLNNFTTLTDLLSRTDPRAYRMLVLRAHYRSPVEVTPETIADAESAVARLDDFARRFGAGGVSQPDHRVKFDEHMEHDLDTPSALAEVFALVRRAHSEGDGGNASEAADMAASVFAMCDAVGLQLRSEGDEIDAESAQLVRQRDEARVAKNWAQADDLRNRLTALGWSVEDTPSGTKIHR